MSSEYPDPNTPKPVANTNLLSKVEDIPRLLLNMTHSTDDPETYIHPQKDSLNVKVLTLNGLGNSFINNYTKKPEHIKPTHDIPKIFTDSYPPYKDVMLSDTSDDSSYDLDRPHPNDFELNHNFSHMVRGLSLADILRLQPGRAVPRTIAQYRLVPITGLQNNEKTLKAAYTSVAIPSDVVPHYGNKGNRPYLDSSCAVGLVYRDVLVAVCSAGIDQRGQIKIVQIQSSYKTNKPLAKEERYKTGLHAGFYWRDTLVQAWIEIATQMNLDQVVIQSGHNNRWARRDNVTKEQKDRYRLSYDEVAARMGFIQGLHKDWVLQITHPSIV